MAYLILTLGYAWRNFPSFSGKVFCGKSYSTAIVFHFFPSQRRTKNGWQFSQMRHDSRAWLYPIICSSQL